MNTLKRLVKEGTIGRLCQRGAWVVAALGSLQIVILLYTSWQVYKEGSQNAGGQPPYGDILNFFILPNVATALQSAATTLFYCLILYSAVAVINAFFAEANKDITYISLDEDAAPADEEAVRTGNNATYPHSH